VPKNETEYFFGILCMLIAGVFWAQMIAVIVAIASAGDPVEEEYHRVVDDMNQYLERENVPQQHRFTARRYLAFSKHAMKTRQMNKVLVHLPPRITSQIQKRPEWTVGYNGPSFMFLSQASDSFCGALIMRLLVKSLPPQESVSTGSYAYILCRGCVCADGFLTTSSNKIVCWGGDFFFKGHNRRFVSPVLLLALTYAELHYFGAGQLEEVMQLFPQERDAVLRRMRWVAVFCVLRFMAAERDFRSTFWDDMKSPPNKKTTVAQQFGEGSAVLTLDGPVVAAPVAGAGADVLVTAL
jgi:hypothetical protein